MIEITLDSITIPENRFRRVFDERRMEELKQSILRNGLLSPITVERVADEFILRTGERRLRVLAEIIKSGGTFHLGNITYAGGTTPAVDFDELTPLKRLEIEVEENVIRSDFTWQERTRALAALHELRKIQNPVQTIAATASEILGKPAQGSERMVVSNALIVNKHLHIPEVARAKNEKEALRAIEKITSAGHRAKLAAAALKQVSPHTLLLGDSLELLSTLPAGSFDVICTDTPYGIGSNTFGEMAATGHDYEDSKDYFDKIFQVFPDESYRVAKERAHVYVFCDVRRFEQLSVLMLLAGWTCFPTPLVWTKGNGMLPFPDHGPRRTYECIFYAWKGDRKTLLVKTDVINISGVRRLKHGAQKPVALYVDLLSRSANPGDTVLDCFGGTGPILVAANRMRLTATYIEKDENSFNIAKLRVDEKEIDDDAVENDGLEDIPF